MRQYSSCLCPLALVLILVTLLANQCHGSYISQGYYKGKCGRYNVEEIIHSVVSTHFKANPDTVADLIRLQFHDCIVRGCDGSILLDGKKTEKTAIINHSVGGFTIVDNAKAAVEKVCPGVVSCSDVLIIAARSAVFMGGGKWYDVETGRRDSLVSYESEAAEHVPKSFMPVDQAIKLFASKGLTKEDFVVLLGGHTVGSSRCDKFKHRLYNFRNTGSPDKRIKPLSFLHYLKRTCPLNSHVNNEVFLDQTPNSQFKIDNGYYKQILADKGVLEIDADMAFSPLTHNIVKGLAYHPTYFFDNFGPAMVKMGRINVLTGNQGEIRKSCRAVNRH